MYYSNLNSGNVCKIQEFEEYFFSNCFQLFFQIHHALHHNFTELLLANAL